MTFPDACNAAQQLLDANLAPERRDRVAFIDRRGAWTFAAVADRAARFAAVLHDLGVVDEQRVVLCLDDTVDFPTAFLGAMQHGAVPVPLNTRLTDKDYALILADSRARVAVVSAPYADLFQRLQSEIDTLQHVIVVGAEGLDARLAAVAPASGFAPTREADVAFWLYTSGTTGQPKGALHAHSHLMDTARLYAQPVLGLTQDDVVLSAAKLYFAYGLGNALTFPMAAGATSVLLEGPPTPQAVTDLLRDHGVTVFYGVPTLYGMLLARPELLPPPDGPLRCCVSAGEALPPELLRRWQEHTGVDILDGIGSTEALHIFISNRAGQVRPGSTGQPVPGYQVRLLDDDDQPVPDDTLGHMEISGPTTALMYWNQRETSKRTFRGTWMRTGDKYRRDADGYYFYGGRADDLLKVGGIWVSPFEVESALLEHASVLECAVVGHDDDDGLTKPRAFVVPREGIAADDTLEAELIAFVRERLAPYKRPRWVTFVDALPKTATGKIQRFQLR